MRNTLAQPHFLSAQSCYPTDVGFGQFRLTKTRTARIWPIWPYACFSPVCAYRVPHPCAPPTGISSCPVQPSRVLKTPGQTTHKCSHQFHPILHYMLLDWCCICPQCSPWIITHGSHSSHHGRPQPSKRGSPRAFTQGVPSRTFARPHRCSPRPSRSTAFKQKRRASPPHTQNHPPPESRTAIFSLST